MIAPVSVSDRARGPRPSRGRERTTLLFMVITLRGDGPAQVSVHSDRGAQYASAQITAFAAEKVIPKSTVGASFPRSGTSQRGRLQTAVPGANVKLAVITASRLGIETCDVQNFNASLRIRLMISGSELEELHGLVYRDQVI